MELARGGGGARPRFVHEVVFHDGPGDRARALLPFLCAGVERGEAALVVLPRASIEELRPALDRELSGGPHGVRDRHLVEFADVAEVAGNPACMIPVWRRFVKEHGGDGRVRGVMEPVWAGRRDTEVSEALVHEALVNLAFDHGPGWHLLCAYDRSRLPSAVVEEARRTHPVEHDLPRPSPSYAGLRHAREVFGTRLGEPPRDALRHGFALGDLADVRHRVQVAGLAAGLDEETNDDLALAAHELATNSVVHADGKGTLLVWSEPAALVVEVQDAGHIADPLVGLATPDFEALGGRGIWMVNRLCDLVQVRSDGEGTQVRLRVWR